MHAMAAPKLDHRSSPQHQFSKKGWSHHSDPALKACVLNKPLLRVRQPTIWNYVGLQKLVARDLKISMRTSLPFTKNLPCCYSLSAWRILEVIMLKFALLALLCVPLLEAGRSTKFYFIPFCFSMKCNITSCMLLHFLSPTKESIHFCWAEYSKWEGRDEVIPYFSSSPPRFWVLAASVYFLLVEDVESGFIFS